MNRAAYLESKILSADAVGLISILYDAALDCLARHGARDEDVMVVKVPGSWEVPLAAQRLAASGKVELVQEIAAAVRWLGGRPLAVVARIIDK